MMKILRMATVPSIQLKIQCNVKMGPPPPGGIPTKRAEETAMSSEDDGLPRSPPEMSLLHDVGPGTTIKASAVRALEQFHPHLPLSVAGALDALRASLQGLQEAVLSFCVLVWSV